MQRPISVFSLLIFFILTACEIKPQPINYGEDACHFCKMTIVDKQHAAQLVTQKGKAFKFDAVECMLNHLEGIDRSEVALYLVNDYMDPGILIDATTSHFIISENIPSPMGEFLSSVKSEEAVLQLQKDKEGSIFTWEEIVEHFNEN
jgi:copper chaperone NosL